MTATDARPTGDRTRSNKLAYAIIGVLVAVCAIGWAIIMAHTEGTPGIVPEVVSYSTSDQAVQVHYTVAKGKGDDVRCTIVALDTRHGEVGRAEVRVPPGRSSVDARQAVRTAARATAVDIRECRSV